MRRFALILTAGVCAASQMVCAQATAVYSRKTISPGDMEFAGRTANLYASVGELHTSGGLRIGASPQAYSHESWPFSNPQGAAIGNATFLGATVGNQDLSFDYTLTGPSQNTRLQYSYDFAIDVQNGPDGFRRLPFLNIVGQSYGAGSLLELEILIDGNWSLGQSGPGGLFRTVTVLDPTHPWTISEDFVFHPTSNQTRFYASRVSTGTGVGERMFVDGYLIGSPIPTPGAAGLVLTVVSGAAVRRRRKAGDSR